MTDAPRDGERRLTFDPADCPDATVSFIGHVRSDWSKGNCPRNIRQARAQGQAAKIELLESYVPALTGLEVGQAIWLLCWMGQSRRDLVIQNPKHAGNVRGTFALRSPARANPIGLSAVRVTSIDGNLIGIDATDVFDGTPVLDIKPWIETVDVPPGLPRG